MANDDNAGPGLNERSPGLFTVEVLGITYATLLCQRSCHQISLCLVDHLKQLLKDRTDLWGVLRAVRAMKSQDGDAGGQLLKGQQSKHPVGVPVRWRQW